MLEAGLSHCSPDRGHCVLGTPLAGPHWPQGVEYIKAHYTKYEYRIPMRDGVKLFTAVYVPKDDSQPYPILLTRTPYSVEPYGVDQYKTDLGPSPLFGKAATSSSTRTCAAAGCRRASSSTCGRTTPPRQGRKDIDESTDTYDTIDWLLKNVPNHNGKVGHVGHLLSRLLHGRRHDRRPSRAQGGLAAGAGHRLVHRRRLAPQRRVLPAARLQLHAALRPSAARSRPRKPPVRLRPRHARRLRLLPRPGPARQRRRQLFQGRRRRSGTR